MKPVARPRRILSSLAVLWHVFAAEWHFGRAHRATRRAARHLDLSTRHDAAIRRLTHLSEQEPRP